MEDIKLTEKESLEVITSMIFQTKKRYIGNGNILLLWGYLTVIVTLLVWTMLVSTRNSFWNILWFIIPIVGGTATIIMSRHEQRERAVVLYSDKITSQLWTIYGIAAIVMTLMCIGFRHLGGINCWDAMLAFTLTATPVAEIAQGLVIREKSFTVGGIIGLAIGMYTLCCISGGIPLGVNWFLPLFIVAFIVMMIVPGHILNYKAKQQ